mgnify:CR=1 FL=1
MVEVSGIKDEESLKAWLDARPKATRQQEAVTLAHRAAMRVLPIFLTGIAGRSPENDLTALPVLRANLISGVACNASTPEIRKAAYFAAFSAAADSADSAARSAAADAASAAAAWDEIRKDAEQLVEAPGQPLGALWSDPDTDPFTQEWTDALAFWQVSPTDWSFWITWANAIRTGTPQNLDMLTEIAIQDDDFWTGTDAEVNARIGEIHLKYAVAASPNAETITREPETGLFQAIPTLDLPQRTLTDAIERARDVIEQLKDAGKTSNKYTALGEEIDLLERQIARYSDNPLRLYETFVKVIRRIDAKTADGLCPEGDLLLEDFRNDLDSGALDILGGSEAVTKTIRNRVGKRVSRLNADEKKRLHALTLVAAKEAIPALAEELREDDAVVADETVPQAEREESGYRLGSRLLRMKKIKREEAVKIADDAGKLNKGAQAAGEAGSTVWDFANWIANFFT